MLDIQNLTYRIAGRTIFEDANAFIPMGRRVGLVGRNGAGKSTLLKLILKHLQPDGGDISLPNTTKIGALAQEAPGGLQTPLDFVLEADEERTRLLKEAETVEDPYIMADIQLRLVDIDAYTAPSRAATILAGLNIDAEAQLRPLSSFSGGWRMRVALAAVLFRQPDLLLLDEPTNHLDFEAAVWLESFLKTYPRTLLIVSHDRHFLNTVVNHILHLEHNKLKLYSGDYENFEHLRAQHLLQQHALQTKIELKRRHMQSFVDRFRAQATKAKQAQSRMKAIAKLETITILKDDSNVALTFPDVDPLPPPLMTLADVTAGYEPEKPILKHLKLSLNPEDRIGLLGANGNGKSTFAKLLAGRIAPMAGEALWSSKLRVGYFAQHQVEDLSGQQTPLEILNHAFPEMTPNRLRAHLGHFGFTQDKVNVKVSSLSGGEKARLSFAVISALNPHVLILDEPTNHLDIEARDTLVKAINDFKGAVILITHDWHLLQLTADRLWVVKNQTVCPFEGDMDDYKMQILGTNPTKGKVVSEKKSSDKSFKKSKAGKRK